MLLNQSGNVSVLMTILVAVVTGNIIMINQRHESFLHILQQTEKKFFLKDFNDYVENLIYDRRICNFLFKGQVITQHATVPNIGDGLWGVEMANLSVLGAPLIVNGQPFDRYETIVPQTIFLEFENGHNVKNNSTFTNRARLKIAVSVEGSIQVLEYPMRFDVSYEIPWTITIHSSVSKAQIAQLMLDGNMSPAAGTSCTGTITSGGANHHQIRELVCSNAYPNKQCLATCKYLRTSEDSNGIVRCL